MYTLEYDIEDKVFYMLSNRYANRLGTFLIMFHEKDPNKFHFILRVKNKLDIDDANITIVRDKERGYKQLLLSHKTIYMNSYNIKVFDLMSPEKYIVYQHESFQLWESKISGYYIPRT